MNWKLFLHHWPFVRGIHRSTMDCLHNGPGIADFCFLLCLREKAVSQIASKLRRQEAHVTPL